MKYNQKCVTRLKNILKQDKETLSVPFLNMIKTDVFSLLNSYLFITPEDVNLKYYIDSSGQYVLNVNVKCNQIKKVNFFNK